MEYKEIIVRLEALKDRIDEEDLTALHSIRTGEFTTEDVYVDDWKYPAGAFHGADGGSC